MIELIDYCSQFWELGMWAGLSWAILLRSCAVLGPWVIDAVQLGAGLGLEGWRRLHSFAWYLARHIRKPGLSQIPLPFQEPQRLSLRSFLQSGETSHLAALPPWRPEWTLPPLKAQTRGLSWRRPYHPQLWEQPQASPDLRRVGSGCCPSVEVPKKWQLSQHAPAAFKKKLFIYLTAWGLSYRTWDLVPWPGFKPRPPALEAQSLSHWTTGEVPASAAKQANPCSRLPGMGWKLNQIFSWEARVVALSQIYGSQLDTLNDQGDSEAPPPPVRMAIILKSLQRAHAEQSVGKREPFRTMGRNANWCSHCGEQYGHPLKT